MNKLALLAALLLAPLAANAESSANVPLLNKQVKGLCPAGRAHEVRLG